MTAIIPVNFHNDTLALVDHDGQPFVPMKPIVENMGLDWASQTVKLGQKFDSVVAIITTTGGDGKQYEMLCLPLRKIPAWLYSINPNKVKPELRDKIIQYQEECDEVLWQYWMQGHVGRGRTSAPTINQQLSAHKLRLFLLDRLAATTDKALREAIHQQLAHVSDLLGIPTPALGDIGKEGHDGSWLAEVLEVLLRDIQAGRYSFPAKIETQDDDRWLVLRTTHSLPGPAARPASNLFTDTY
ncbi:phage antirepressor N-terminal domain-containing protein [Cellvibrio japonicus]|uniref:Antirepressor protein n=1 Tax=Cellvibrio japonicus (strain Ueda107) TaxID=498211 RepID=B3PFB6_CELJU|nr:phage antirepressor N-terminal domain-containing protein [Cellvibrio japonicus]ACE85838.1 antirepressor protein [Cellvibrio japonicus Ueda107]QEI13665.1 hypothetical protein FY117_16570 [Cellvibrio japonicus]QEI17239.1 hypothetical protein FY116_16575 [Cellvibrio japonicus]QEI20816.1 hypothetical protein FY115_16570 [Cellvibrio japonicus]